MFRALCSILALAIMGMALTSCEEKKPAEPVASARTGTALPAREPDSRTAAAILEKQGPAGPAGSAAPSLPAGHPALGNAPAATGDGQLKFTAPSGWKKVAVTSTMRKAQFVLPKAAGDSEDGQLVVYYFGQGQGGTTESNINRWKGMFTTADGKPIGDDAMKRESMQIGGMNVTVVDVIGRYTDQQMGRPVASAPTAQDYRMFAAVIETEEGPWFFKAVGPAATMASHVSDFNEFVHSVRK